MDTEGNYTVGPSQPPAPSTRATFCLGGLPGELGEMLSRQNTPKPRELLFQVQDRNTKSPALSSARLMLLLFLLQRRTRPAQWHRYLPSLVTWAV